MKLFAAIWGTLLWGTVFVLLVLKLFGAAFAWGWVLVPLAFSITLGIFIMSLGLLLKQLGK